MLQRRLMGCKWNPPAHCEALRTEGAQGATRELLKDADRFWRRDADRTCFAQRGHEVAIRAN